MSEKPIRDALGNIISQKREVRRSMGWPSGRQWRKKRKALQWTRLFNEAMGLDKDVQAD